MKPRPSRVFWGILCFVTASCALVWPILPMVSGSDRLASLPMKSRFFQSQDWELTPAETEFLGGASAVQRVIVPLHGPTMILSVIDGSGNRHAVHDPRYCLAGGGWIIRSEQRMAMSSGEAHWISMEKDGESMEALWFFDDGERQFTSPIRYWWSASLRRATRGLSGSEPLLVMLRVAPDQPADWTQIRQEILPALGFSSVDENRPESKPISW